MVDDLVGNVNREIPSCVTRSGILHHDIPSTHNSVTVVGFTITQNHIVGSLE